MGPGLCPGRFAADAAIIVLTNVSMITYFLFNVINKELI